MTKKSTRGKKAPSGGKTLRVSKQTLKDLTPTARASNAAKGGRAATTHPSCGGCG